MKQFLLKFGYTVAALGTGTFLNACGGAETQPDMSPSSSSLATATFALISVPMDVSCVRAKAKGTTRSVTRDQDVVPGKASTFSLSGLPSGSVVFDMDAFSAPCEKVAKDQVPSWVADTQTVFLTNGASTPVSVTLRRNAQAAITADFVDDNLPPPPPPPPPPGGLQFSPPFFDFGSVTIGTLATADFKLSNLSSSPSAPILVSIARPDPDLTINASDCARPLPPNNGCRVVVTFSPKSIKNFKTEVLATAGMLKAAATISGSSVQTPPPPPPGAKLIGKWSFNAVKGSVVPDDSGSGNTGEIVQGTAPNSLPVAGVVVPGKIGTALDLSPKNTWVRVKRSSSIDELGTTGAFTVAGWIKTGALPSPTGFNSIISRNEVGAPFEHFGLSLNAGKPSATVHFFFTTADGPAPLGQWTHLTGVYDGITLSLYVNGVLATSMDIGWPIAADTTDVVIGAKQSVDVIKDFFAGSVDEVRLYNGALNASEVSSLLTAM